MTELEALGSSLLGFLWLWQKGVSGGKANR